MTPHEKYIELFQKSNLSKTVWGLLFNYSPVGSTAYKVTHNKLSGIKDITPRDQAIMKLIEYLIDKNLLYDFILSKIKLSKNSLTRFRKKFFHHVEIDCPQCYHSNIQFMPGHLDPSNIEIICDHCGYKINNEFFSIHNKKRLDI